MKGLLLLQKVHKNMKWCWDRYLTRLSVWDLSERKEKCGNLIFEKLFIQFQCFLAAQFLENIFPSFLIPFSYGKHYWAPSVIFKSASS